MVPLLLLFINKLSIDNNYDRWGSWHRQINRPVERALSPAMDSVRVRWNLLAPARYRVHISSRQVFEKLNFYNTPEYGLDTFIWLAMLRLMPIVVFLYALIRVKATPLEVDLMKVSILILSIFFVEFLLVYNMIDSAPKLITGAALVLLAVVRNARRAYKINQ